MGLLSPAVVPFPIELVHPEGFLEKARCEIAFADPFHHKGDQPLTVVLLNWIYQFLITKSKNTTNHIVPLKLERAFLHFLLAASRHLVLDEGLHYLELSH